MKALSVLLLVFSAGAAYALDGDPHPFGKALLLSLVETPQYRELETLYEEQRKTDKGGQSSRQRRMLATLISLRSEALSATNIDPQGSEDRVVNYTDHNGVVHRFTSIVPSFVENDETRYDVAETVAGFLIDGATADHRLPFALPPDRQKIVEEAMTKGYAAAERKDYRSALRNFENALGEAPGDVDIYYNLGLAASNIPGGELRGIVWFGAYLAADPGSPQADAVREKMRELDQQALARFIGLMTEIAEQTPGQGLKDAYLAHITEFWASAGNHPLAFHAADGIQDGYEKVRAFTKIAGAQARQGDFAAAFATAARILNADGKSTALRDICDAESVPGRNIFRARDSPKYREPLGKELCQVDYRQCPDGGG